MADLSNEDQDNAVDPKAMRVVLVTGANGWVAIDIAIAIASLIKPLPS